MKWFAVAKVTQWALFIWRSFLGAVTFYTSIPVPTGWAPEFQRIARWAPAVGLLIGGILGLADVGLQALGMPLLTRSTLIVAFWIGLTGGLHLDGAMDTADGLAVLDRQRRLQVMADSATGAFGAMAAIAILLLKTTALIDLESYRWLALMGAAGWGRWGQVIAIASYPYLRPGGKGEFHQAAMRPSQDIVLGLIVLLSACGLPLVWNPAMAGRLLSLVVAGSAIALLTGAWFYRQLGGHTGDTYGAVVEWTEALLLCFLTLLGIGD